MGDKKQIPSADDCKKFLLNMREALSDTGVTPYALAKKIGFEKSGISGFFRESRDPRLSTVLRIAKGMQVSLDRLLEGIYTPLSSSSVKVPENKNLNIGLFNKISEMHGSDAELLESIADLFIARKKRSMANLLLAVQKTKPKKEKLMPNTATAEFDEYDEFADIQDDDDLEDKEDIDDEDADSDFDDDDFGEDDDDDEKDEDDDGSDAYDDSGDDFDYDD